MSCDCAQNRPLVYSGGSSGDRFQRRAKAMVSLSVRFRWPTCYDQARLLCRHQCRVHQRQLQ